MTMFEQADVPENIAMDVVGHEQPNITFGHYSGTPIEQKYDAVCKSISDSFHDTPTTDQSAPWSSLVNVMNTAKRKRPVQIAIPE